MKYLRIFFKKEQFIEHFIHALIITFSFSAFIYFEKFGLSSPFINTFLALGALYGFLSFPPRSILMAGYLIGLVWFYWIAYSFEYYNVPWMIPIITLFFAFLYMLYFGMMALSNNPLRRAGILFLLSFVEPFDWNWMMPELIFVNSYFGVEKWQFGLILLSLGLLLFFKDRPKRYLLLLLLTPALSFTKADYKIPDIKIKLVETQLEQHYKWQHKNQGAIIQENINHIHSAINEGYEMVVLPESAFPMHLNYHSVLIKHLQKLSKQITIYTGALYTEQEQHFNVSYIFQDGKYTIAKKTILVPFGEYIPLPKFMQGIINEIFFDGISDFKTADEATDFEVKGIKFRSAICYEATCHEMYKGRPEYMIVISNNGWFLPSVEPVIQRLIMKLYATRYGTVIFHAANREGTGIVTP